MTLIRLIAIPEHWKQPVLAPLTRTHEPHNIRPVFRVRSLRPIPLSKLASAFAAHDPAQADLLLEMSNCYCHPGRAGGTPITLDLSGRGGPEALQMYIASTPKVS